MKKYIIYISIVLTASFLLYSCSSVESSKEEYFGFNNNPKVTQPSNSDNYAKSGKTSSNKWVNPLSDDFDDSFDGYVAYNMNNRYFDSRPHYISIIVPWWDYYYGWGPYYWNAHFLYYHHHYWDWYWTMNFYRYNYYPWTTHHYACSPWYWYRRPYFYDWWYYSDYNRYNPIITPTKEKTYRDWGVSRGSTTVGNAYDFDKSISNSPRSRTRDDVTNTMNKDGVPDKFKSKDNFPSKPGTDDRNYRSPSRNTNREVIDNNNNSGGTLNRSGESSGSSSGSGSSGSSGSSGTSGSSGSSGSGSNSNTERSSTRPR